MTQQCTTTRHFDGRLKGFTLIEMMVVVGIIAILVGIGGPAMGGYVTRSRLNTANASAKVIFNSAQTICQEFEFLDRNGSSGEFYGYTGSPSAPATMEAISTGSLFICGDKDAYDRTNNRWFSTGNTVTVSNGRASAYEIIGGLALNSSNTATAAEAALTANPDDTGSSFIGRMSRLFSDLPETCFSLYIENYQVRYVLAATTMDTTYVGMYPSRATAKVGEAGGAPFTIADSDMPGMAANTP